MTQSNLYKVIKKRDFTLEGYNKFVKGCRKDINLVIISEHILGWQFDRQLTDIHGNLLKRYSIHINNPPFNLEEADYSKLAESLNGVLSVTKFNNPATIINALEPELSIDTLQYKDRVDMNFVKRCTDTTYQFLIADVNLIPDTVTIVKNTEPVITYETISGSIDLNFCISRNTANKTHFCITASCNDNTAQLTPK